MDGQTACRQETLDGQLRPVHNRADNSRLVHLSSDEVERQLGEGQLDAAMLVASCESPAVQRLLRRKDLALMDFAHQNLAHTRLFAYLRPVQIYEGLFDLKDDIPGRDLTLMAPAAILAGMESFSRKIPAHLQGEVYQWRLHVSLVRSEALDRLRRMSPEAADRAESACEVRFDPQQHPVPSAPSGAESPVASLAPH
jgi:hypothetical protein